ncbi:MAG: sugar ABC transporter permease [Clostridia bacterium]|nr:sugar ABC transporter permease [Clostridia bacterium]
MKQAISFGQAVPRQKKPRLLRELAKNKYIYIMLVPFLLFYIIFMYGPMYGAMIAFKDFTPKLGILGSPWVGIKHFEAFFGSIYFWRLLRNTISISLQTLVFGFPAPIILALLLNEVRQAWFKKTVQTISYMPHFISLVVVCGIIKIFTGSEGIINDFMVQFGQERRDLLLDPALFQPIYVISDIWQKIGWESIIYLAALSGVDQELYEAARIDGAGKWRQLLSVTLPCILPTIVVMLILRVGSMMNIGFEKIILLYNGNTYETADVISSYVYRKGIQEFSYSFSTAVGLFNSVINFFLVLSANTISKKVNDTSLW